MVAQPPAGQDAVRVPTKWPRVCCGVNLAHLLLSPLGREVSLLVSAFLRMIHCALHVKNACSYSL